MASFGKTQFKHQSTLLEFFEFIYNRQEVWHNRFVLKKPPPWTDDPILRQYKFCNCYRELDRCTQYLINRVINNPALSNKQKVFAILIFRIFNQDGLFDKYFHEVPAVELFDANLRIKELDEAKERGLNLFNNAYNITQRTYLSTFRKGEKHVQHLLNLQNIAKDWNGTFNYISNASSPQQIFECFKSLNFIGPFLAYQCLTDISYMNYNGYRFDDFVSVGPGALGGIEALSGGIPKGCTSPEEKCKYLFNIQESAFFELWNKTRKDWRIVRYANRNLSLADVQNCACEYRKFLNYKVGIKCRKKYYKGDADGLSHN